MNEVASLSVRSDLRSRAETVAAIAAKDAAAVDRDARFPQEAIAAARVQRLMGIMVPREFGGEDAELGDVLDVCYLLARACSSTGMIYAMHQIMVACVLRHRQESGWHGELLRRLCGEQMLFASSTTEGKGGGNVRASEAPIERAGERISLERRATVISYGANADAIITTARRAPDAAASEQVLVAFLKEHYVLEPIMQWDTLGMRGTCSAGFTLKASGNAEQVLPVPYDTIHVQTMTPVAHLSWASVWTGVAAAAVERAQLFIRNAARHSGGQLPPGAAHYTKASISLMTLRGLVTSFLTRFKQIEHDEKALASLDFQTAVNLTKVEASELAVSTVMSALRASGLSGYRNDGEFTVGRYLRDVLSSPIMINNDRILANIGSSALMSDIPRSLRG